MSFELLKMAVGELLFSLMALLSLVVLLLTT